MQMSKNRPQVYARDGKCGRWNCLPAIKLKTVVSASCRHRSVWGGGSEGE
jgi:hypothetical protein